MLQFFLQCCCRSVPARYVLAIMGFMGMFNVYSLRVSMSPVIVAMVNYSAIDQPAKGKVIEVESSCHDHQNLSSKNFGKFLFNQTQPSPVYMLDSLIQLLKATRTWA